MSKYNFDELVDRKGTWSYKWDVKDNELPMWVADMDFHSLPEINEAIKERLTVDSYGYSYAPEEFFKAYQGWWNRRHHVNIPISSMMFSTGVVASIDSILKHIIPPHSGVVVQAPVYHVFFNCVINNQHELLMNQLIYKDGQYSIDFDDLEKLLKQENTKAMILCNPHNPIGRIWNKEELKKISSLCEENDVLLISDEIHCDIVEPNYEYVPILSVTDNAIALLAGSKVFNIAGLHSSVIVCKNQELYYKIENGIGQDDLGEPNYFASAANIAAFNKGDQWVDELNAYVYKNKQYVYQFINKELPQLSLIDIKATYLLWIDISAYSNKSDEFANELRNETGLIVSCGKQFGPGGESFIRVNIATSKKNVEDACRRLKEFISKKYTA